MRQVDRVSLWRRVRHAVVAAAVASACAMGAADADAFCGFYVGGAGTKLFNNATMVVLMRDGTRTVLSMQNNYEGPPQGFAMVVPVPVVLQETNVKTLPREVFDHIDALAAPRLVEYWEQDPCMERPKTLASATAFAAASPPMAAPGGKDEYGVKIEAQFQVGEYQIVILSADDSSGLERWLKDNQYAIPDGTEPLLRPYVQGGSKFFVAKVDVTKVKMEKGMALLSPLRFHYDAETFSLPVRLGLANSKGTQDLIVHILAKNQRYDVANYKNVTIPTNIDIDEKAKDQFPAFYAALFDRTIEETPGAVVTEYSWDAGTCDPCPGPALSPKDLATLGADALPGTNLEQPPWQWSGGFVVTRLHARYKKEALGEDLVFRKADPIAGGREHFLQTGAQRGQKLETGSSPSPVNNFQGRYAIRHPWTGPISCANPVRGQWGGPPSGTPYPETKAARDLAFAPRGEVKLPELVRHDVPEIKLKAAAAAVLEPGQAPQKPQASGGCGCAIPEETSDRPRWGLLAIALASLTALVRRRRRSDPGHA